MNYETKRSHIYKELHPNYFDRLLQNPTFYESLGLVACGLLLGAIITAVVVIGH